MALTKADSNVVNIQEISEALLGETEAGTLMEFINTSIASLQSDLDGKANVGHTHDIGDIVGGLNTIIDYDSNVTVDNTGKTITFTIDNKVAMKLSLDEANNGVRLGVGNTNASEFLLGKLIITQDSAKDNETQGLTITNRTTKDYIRFFVDDDGNLNIEGNNYVTPTMSSTGTINFDKSITVNKDNLTQDGSANAYANQMMSYITSFNMVNDSKNETAFGKAEFGSNITVNAIAVKPSTNKMFFAGSNGELSRHNSPLTVASFDGTQLTFNTVATTFSSINDVVYDSVSDKFVAVGNTGNIRIFDSTLPSGTSTVLTATTSTTLKSVAATSAGTIIATGSADSKVHIKPTTGPVVTAILPQLTDLEEVTVGEIDGVETAFIVGVGNKIYYSTGNFLSWSFYELPSNKTWVGVTCFKNRVLCVSSVGDVIISYDGGENWTNVNNIEPTLGTSTNVTYTLTGCGIAGGSFCLYGRAVSNGGDNDGINGDVPLLMTSVDGLKWITLVGVIASAKEINNGDSWISIESVCYDEVSGLFAFAGDDGEIRFLYMPF